MSWCHVFLAAGVTESRIIGKYRASRVGLILVVTLPAGRSICGRWHRSLRYDSCNYARRCVAIFSNASIGYTTRLRGIFLNRLTDLSRRSIDNEITVNGPRPNTWKLAVGGYTGTEEFFTHPPPLGGADAYMFYRCFFCFFFRPPR